MTDEELRQHIKRLVDDWPPLTADQRARLAILLRPVSGHPNSHIPGQRRRKAIT